MTIVPRDPHSEVVDKKQKIMPDWYSWFNELTGVANSAAPSPGGGGLSPPFIIPADFGVVADGVTDDTAALNAMFASVAGQSAIVLWPKTGFCITSDTVTVGIFGSAGPHTHVSIQGVGTTENCGITYIGPADREILRFAKCTNFFINDFRLLNGSSPSYPTGSRGSSVGISLSGNGAVVDGANQCNNFVFSRVAVYRCHIAVCAGKNGASASEGTFIHLAMAENDIGFTTDEASPFTALNSLDFQFIQLLGTGNGRLIDTGVSNGVNVFGGSSTANDVAFFCAENATMEIIAFRSEHDVRFMDGFGGRVTLQTVAVSAPPSPFISISGSYTKLCIKNSIITGSISLTGNHPDYVEMTGNFIDNWDTLHNIPFTLTVSPGTNILKTSVNLQKNYDVNSPRSPIPDWIGDIGARNSVIGAKLFYEPNTTRFPLDNSGAPSFGVESLALNHVRQLSESTMGGAISNIAPTPGKNLRVAGKLSAGSINFTFKRNLTITGIGDPTITATAGTWVPTDAGKPLFIVQGCDNLTDWYGYITDYISPTQVNVFLAPGIHSQPQGVGKAATVGEDEPDANYIVAGLCGDAIPPESYSVTAKTSTGFTITSSNGASTALVTALIVR